MSFPLELAPMHFRANHDVIEELVICRRYPSIAETRSNRHLPFVERLLRADRLYRGRQGSSSVAL